MKASAPLVSVIIPVFNRAEILKRSIDSVKRQTYPNLEIIVVDDGSTEDIISVARRCFDNITFQYQMIQQKNSGPGLARKKGLEHAKGDYFLYLDSDDELHPEMIEVLSGELSKDPKILMACCDFESETGKRVDISNWQGMDLLELSLNVRPWHTSSCLWHYPDRSRVLWPSLFSSEDIVHDVSVAIQGFQWVHIPRVLVTIHKHVSQLSVLNSRPQNLERKRRDMFQSREIILNLLIERNLVGEKKYAMPFSERCLRGAVELASMGYKEDALAVLGLTSRLNITFIQKFQIFLLYLLLKLNCPFPKAMYYTFFKIHRKISPVSLHGNKSILMS